MQYMLYSISILLYLELFVMHRIYSNEKCEENASL